MDDLIQSEMRYSTLVETIPHGIEEIDVFGNILFGNSAYHKLLGYHAGRLIGKNMIELLSTEEEKEALRNYLVFLVNDQPTPTLYLSKILTKQGKIIDVEVAWNYKRDQSGQVIGFISIITDITNRLKREQEFLMANEQLNVYKTLIDYIPHVIWTGNSKGQITFLNKAWKKWTGREIVESMGIKWTESIHPDDADSLLKKWENAYAGGEPYHGDCRFVHQNGQVIHCSYIGFPIKGADKKVKYWAGIDFDITELKKSQTELYESQAKTQALLNAISESALLLDAQGTILELNKTAAQRFEKTPDEIIGKNAKAVFPKKLAESRLKIASEVINSGKPINFEDKRGDRFLSNTIYPVFNKDSKVNKLAIYSRDITNEKKAEKVLRMSHDKLEKLVEKRTKSLKETVKIMQQEMEERKLVEKELINNKNIIEDQSKLLREAQRLSHFGSWNWDMENNKVTGSQEGYHILGIDKESSYQRAGSFMKLVHPDDIENVNRVLLDLIKTGGNTEFEYRIIRPDGNERMLRAWSNIEYNANGSPSKMTGAVLDITEQMKAEEALKISEEKLRTLYESSGEALMVRDHKGYLECNKAALKMFGCKSKEELYEIGQSELSPDILSNTLSIIQVLQENQKTAIERGNIQFERELKRMDGTMFDGEVRVTSMKLGGKNVIQAIVRDITASKLEIKKMKERKGKLRALASKIEKVREEERTYIAREIHDELGHSLTALLIDLHALNNKTEFQNNETSKELASMINLVNQSINTIRKIASDLRPGILDKLGLGSAIEWQLEEFKRRNKIDCFLDIENVPLGKLSKEMETALFRIFQEILTNISKHAKATRVNVILKVENKKVRLNVKDNGVGIQKENMEKIDSLGILGMQERVNQLRGDFFIDEQKRGGTEVKITIPINN